MKVVDISKDDRLGSSGATQNVFTRLQNTFQGTLSPNALRQELEESWNLAWRFFSCSQICAIGDRINRWKSWVDEYNSRLFTRGICLNRRSEPSRISRAKRRLEIWAFSWRFFSFSQIYGFGARINRWKPRVGKPYSRLFTRGICMGPTEGF